MNTRLFQKTTIGITIFLSVNSLQAYNFEYEPFFTTEERNIDFYNPSPYRDWSYEFTKLVNGCVYFPRLKYGQEMVYRTKTFDSYYDEPGISDNIKRVVGSTSSELSIQGQDNSVFDPFDRSTYDTENFSVANNYKYITSSDYSTSDIRDFKEYSPYRREAIDWVCPNQTWTSSYTINQSSIENGRFIDYGPSAGLSEINTIEKINIFKRVPAGLFKTYQQRTEDGYSITTKWVDINTGVTVLVEEEDNSGHVFSRKELMSLTYNP